MPILNELVVTVAGGVLTALILGVFTGRRNKSNQTASSQSTPSETDASNGPSAIGQFFHLILAVLGGYMLFSTAGKFVIKSGILQKGFHTKMLVLVVCTALVWWVLLLFRGKK